MSFPVAVQSAAFYFLACTPCTQIRHRQKAAQRAKKEREEKARVVAEQPHLYQHPDPFNTNPYWAEEIQIGPSLPKKGRAGSSSKNTSQRGLTAVSRDGTASVATTSQLFTSPGGRPSTTTSPTNILRIGSGPTIVCEEDMAHGTLSKTASVSTADDWNLKRYQREDEELWGTWTGHKLMDAIKQAGTTAGRFVESKLGLEREVTEEDRHNFYFSPRNPPVNDYHPPVVSSKPLHKDGLRWMLQPPPPAKIMEGKVPVSRSASMMSAGSRRTTTTMGSLSRQVGERGLEARLRSGESPFDNELYSTSSLNRTRPRAATKSTTRTKSRRTARSNSLSTDEGESSEGPAQRIRRPSYRATATPDIESEDDEDEYIPKSLDIFNKPGVAGTNAGHVVQKTRLSTILSSETTAATVNTSAENIAAATPRHTSNLESSLQESSTPNTSVTSTPTSVEDRNNSNSSQRQEKQRQEIVNGIDKKLIAMAAASSA